MSVKNLHQFFLDTVFMSHLVTLRFKWQVTRRCYCQSLDLAQNAVSAQINQMLHSASGQTFKCWLLQNKSHLRRQLKDPFLLLQALLLLLYVTKQHKIFKATAREYSILPAWSDQFLIFVQPYSAACDSVTCSEDTSWVQHKSTHPSCNVLQQNGILYIPKMYLQAKLLANFQATHLKESYLFEMYATKRTSQIIPDTKSSEIYLKLLFFKHFLSKLLKWLWREEKKS